MVKHSAVDSKQGLVVAIAHDAIDVMTDHLRELSDTVVAHRPSAIGIGQRLDQRDQSRFVRLLGGRDALGLVRVAKRARGEQGEQAGIEARDRRKQGDGVAPVEETVLLEPRSVVEEPSGGLDDTLVADREQDGTRAVSAGADPSADPHTLSAPPLDCQSEVVDRLDETTG